MGSYLDELNPSQRAAVEHIDGPSLVIAGAGSGKTRVLTYKVAHLMEQGFSPYSILALTFTNKAAKEMKSRIARVTGEFESRHLWMGTFHSIFSRILRAEAETLGFPSTFTIYDSSDSKSLINNIIKSGLNLDNKHYKPKVVQARISLAKNSLVTPSAYANDQNIQVRDKSQRLPHIKEIYRIYTKRCKEAGAMDFDDLLLYTNILFRDHPKILEKYQDMFRFILVDEYQDTNYAQFLIVRQLAKRHGRVCVVGDDAQSIYSFRGARLDNMLQFPKIFDKAQVFKLEQNYRSTQNIVKAANSLIAKNKGQFEKNTFSENDEGSPILINNYYSDREEGFSVARTISDLVMRGDTYEDCAILYRTNSQSRNFEEALRKMNFPYKIYGGLSFYQRKEIKDLLAYFRISSNARDNEALKRIVNFPARGLGQKTVEKVEIASNLSGASMLDVCKNPLEYNAGVNAGTAKKLVAFAELIESFQNKITEKAAHEMAEIILNESGILKEFSDQSDIENLSRKDNIQEMLNALTIFENDRKTENENEQELVTLLHFLEEVSLLTDQDEGKDQDTNRITMMTVHASKGLEFKNVFVVGMEKELFPSLQSMDSPSQYEEERRLFYVAITRAEARCYLSYAKSRYQWGKATICTPSPFLRDIDNRFLSAPGDISFKTKRTIEREQNGPSNDAQKIAALRTQQARKMNTVSPDFTPSNPNEITTGLQVEHARFGIGKVINMEGNGEGAKATIFFQKEGQKNLLLKFAKLKIIK